MAPGTKKKSDMAKFTFYKDRLMTFKNFEYDRDPDAKCTSQAVAQAGFYCTGPQSGKCAFCNKELDFDPEDDPWYEHTKRDEPCEFVRIGKLDDSELTINDTVRLSQTAMIMTKLFEHEMMINNLSNHSSSDALFDQLKKVPNTASTTKSNSRRGK
ncbi:Chromosomal passenger complex protein bir-1 [Caenorhabditis elegans]|uniref:Chromosomal passenger complex protein bir-1 n=1 Tax=Caenorhabditis elegans TaxID=6239 RepID=BIR1_CAEEL|nr:Chromosomal passenger complex protein bir-1 [Caenorhabditis elegans]G5EFA2.1 RecName: Full=Chromosomal passenger complex protein bir-1; AltName: Full=Baculoviral IAP repeat-containing protein bir-1 [Caenorhabditis elegans]AAB94330.1 inhibitor of apoptosis homolog [Caenorhabditis elegans]CAA98553.1 Chromosomal passenger complex protein bir-1 [Caenorhabditis elegans]|eukprot:NP_505949.1 Chromosomal passenger complex protein bir-1 [Caenorhabditis elegans]